MSSWDYQVDEAGLPLTDPTLHDPRCVFQLMKKHYERYDIDTVCKITGTPKNKYLEVLNTYCATGAPDKTGNIMYAMGITQHTVGSQNVRSFAMVQLLLGNMGRPGGGVNALRGENNVQGATDMALLFHIIPGYIDSPMNTAANKDLLSFIRAQTPGAAKLPFTNLEEFRALVKAGFPNSGFKINTSKWVISLLKAWWGKAATADNDFGYHYLPKRDGNKNYSHIALFEAMHRGEIDGLFVNGTNPVVGGPNANKEQEALTKLKWMVSVDLWLNETADYWTYQGWERTVKIPMYQPILQPIFRQRYFSYRQLLSMKKKVPPPRPVVGYSSAGKEPIRWVNPKLTFGYTTSWARESRSSMPAAPNPRTNLLSTWTGTMMTKMVMTIS